MLVSKAKHMFSHGINPVDIFFQVIVLLFAICVHESAHAWMANRLGDPTAKMLGRVSLNPIVHIDPIGTILMPLILIVLGFPPFGWAKPTPGDTRKFKNPVRDDILTTVAGPVSNLLTAFVSVIILAVIARHSASGIGPNPTHVDIASPLITLFYLAMWINVILAVFNMIPLPPLDGSHVLRHFLSYNALQVYDRIGNWGLIVVVFLLPMIGINIVGMLIMPFMAFFQALLALFLGIR
jgi:Zn-dependent protease